MKHFIKSIYYFILNAMCAAISSPQYFLFNKALSNVENAQSRVLSRIIKKNRKTKFGIEHNFCTIDNPYNFQSNVPIMEYEDYIPYLSLILKGSKNILTKEDILLLEPTSGSSAASKTIPYTKALKKEFQNGISTWLFDTFWSNKKLLFGSSYWSITPSLTKNFKTESGVTLGFENDFEYFGNLKKYVIKHIVVIPSEVSDIKSIEAFKYVTLFFLLKNKELSFISIWNPTFLTHLLEPILKWSDMLVDDIKKGTLNNSFEFDENIKSKLTATIRKDAKRANELKIIFDNWTKGEKREDEKHSYFEEIWPYLTIISCWADGNSFFQIKKVEEIFPNVSIQPKGLVATEGFVSIPLFKKSGAALALNSHFFEFEDLAENRNVKLAHQIEKNRYYSVIITTGGGFYRYKLKDIIQVVGFNKQCPLIRFVSKEDKISDLFGEKLNEHHIIEILVGIFNKYLINPKFFMLAPEVIEKNKHFYTLFLQLEKIYEKDLFKSIINELEEELQKNFHYKYCRKIGQLSKLKAYIINDDIKASERYLDVCKSNGQKLGNIKPSVLHPQMGWSKEFKGFFV